MALNAAAIDKRIKAVVASTMYDMRHVMSKGYFDSTTPEKRAEALDQLRLQRWEDAKNGTPAYGPISLALQGGEPGFVVQYAAYYKDRNRGVHPRAINSNASWTITTPPSFMNVPLLSYINEIPPRPMLLVHGENAHSRYFSEKAYQAAAEPKELVIVPDVTHTDLYDQMDKIPFGKIIGFFSGNL